ncbi:p48 polypeptide of DNA primase, variant 2 [Pleurotus ostreatus]|nr:p48 polypeptide of DNA primase, variant 2 [Pleurotus ostreatus]
MDATAMPTFYRRIYPYKSIFLWLNHEHNPTKLFTHREFAFTLPGDVYLRYQSFANAEEFKKQLCSMTPTRFEIGPVYSGRPRDRKTLRPSAFVPVQRELVFDIDMTDYDNIRTCCSGAAICKRCWGFIAAAVKVLDKAIRDQFGYQHLLWVYSGRRGIHLWISDQEAVDLTDDQRKAIVNYLTVVATSKEASKHLNVRSNGALPSLLSNALLDLGTIFDSLILKDQDLFAGEQAWLALLELLPQSMRGTLEAKWSSGEKNSSAKWDDVKGVINGLKSQSLLACGFQYSIGCYGRYSN